MDENGMRRTEVTAEMLRAMLDRVRERSADPRTDLLLLATLVVTAGRASEILTLTRGDVDAERCLLRLSNEKGARWWPVPDYLVQELLSLASERGSCNASDRVFVVRGRTATYRPVSYHRLGTVLGGYRRPTDEPQPAITVAALRTRTIRLLAAHPEVTITAALGHVPRGMATFVRSGVSLGLVVAVVETFGGDHPWLHEPPDARA